MKFITSQNLTAVFIFLTIGLSAQNNYSKGLESISKAELKDHIYFLASDYMNGRVGPSTEYEIAAQYVASQYASAGLQVLGSEMESMDGYFQNVPFVKLDLEKRSSMILKSKTGEEEFLHNEHYKVWYTGNLSEDPMNVIFVGYGIQEPGLGWDDLKGLDLEGNMVVMMSGAPFKQDKAVFPDSIHQKYLGSSGLNPRIENLMEHKVAAIIFAFDSSMIAKYPFSTELSYLDSCQYKYLGHSGKAEYPISYFTEDTLIHAIFKDQKSSPALIEEKGLDYYATFQLEDVQMISNYPLKDRKELSLKNVVAMVPGTDSALSHEIITVGAHLDHISLSSAEVANGADDNASGCAGVMEIAEAIAMNPPRRTVAFISYAAEEMGHYGSDFFVNQGPLALENIKFNVNLDMIGRTKKENLATGAHYVLGPAEFEKELQPFITKINEESINWPLIFDFHHPAAGQSDHASYAKKGIPCFFFFSGRHEDLHQAGDDPDKIEYDKVEAISRLAYLITMELANMEEVPEFGGLAASREELQVGD